MGCTSSRVAPELPFSSDNSGGQPETSLNEKHQRLHALSEGAVGQAADPIRQRALKALNSSVERELAKNDNRSLQKALFLGTGESGKSTVFKQMRLCYGESFDEFEREQYSKLIWADTLRAIRVLVDICDEERRAAGGSPELKEVVYSWLGKLPSGKTTAGFNEPGTDPHRLADSVQLIQSLNLTRRAFLEEEADANAKAFLHVHLSATQKPMAPNDEGLLLSEDRIPEPASQPVLSQAMTGFAIHNEFQEAALDARTVRPPHIEATRANVGAVALRLWETCPESIKLMVTANQLGLETNAAFFLNKLNELKNERYIAMNDDILHARIKTTGITTAEFNVKSHQLLVMDVGGQRVERKKWIHSFDDVTCVLFVASVSEYDQGLEEQEAVNRLDEALEVFQQTINSQWFRAKSVQLFLNKVDILKLKCRYSSFSAHFPGYKGSDTDPDDIIRYIESLFRERFRAGNRNLYVHRTCATDTTTMKFVVDAVSDMILFENMKWAGMV